jgi:DNA-binding transcriptional LysR family regulator
VQLRQLEYLVALARVEHFRRAADACSVSQPTLSNGIRALETELGFAVVRRGQRYAGLTPEGERLVDFARRMLHERDELLAELGPQHRGLSGRMRLGAIPTSLPPFPLVMNPFRRSHPGVDLTVLSLSSTEILRQLATFDIDAGVTYLDGATPPTVCTTVLYDERYLLITAEGAVPAEREDITWAEAAELPLCLLTPDMQNRQIVDELFHRARVSPTPKVETNSISALLAHVRWGECSAVVPQAWLRTLGVPDGTRVLPLSGPEHTSRIGLVWLDRQPEPSLLTALLASLAEVDLQATLDAVLS